MSYEFWLLIGTRAKKMFFVKEVRSKHPMSQMISFSPDCRSTELQLIWILNEVGIGNVILFCKVYLQVFRVSPTLPDSSIIIHITTRTPTLLTLHFHNVLALWQLEAARRPLVAFIILLYSLFLPFLSSPTSFPPNTISPVSAFILVHYVLPKV